MWEEFGEAMEWPLVGFKPYSNPACLPFSGTSHTSACSIRSMQGCWRGLLFEPWLQEELCGFCLRRLDELFILSTIFDSVCLQTVYMCLVDLSKEFKHVPLGVQGSASGVCFRKGVGVSSAHKPC